MNDSKQITIAGIEIFEDLPIDRKYIFYARLRRLGILSLHQLDGLKIDELERKMGSRALCKKVLEFVDVINRERGDILNNTEPGNLEMIAKPMQYYLSEAEEFLTHRNYPEITAEDSHADDFVLIPIAGRFDKAFYYILKILGDRRPERILYLHPIWGRDDRLYFYLKIPSSEIKTIEYVNISNFYSSYAQSNSLHGYHKRQQDMFLGKYHPIYRLNMFACDNPKATCNPYVRDKIKEFNGIYYSQLMKELYKLYPNFPSPSYGENERTKRLWAYFKLLYEDTVYWYHEDWMHNKKLHIYIPSIHVGIDMAKSPGSSAKLVQCAEHGITYLIWDSNKAPNFIRVVEFIQNNKCFDKQFNYSDDGNIIVRPIVMSELLEVYGPNFRYQRNSC